MRFGERVFCGVGDFKRKNEYLMSEGHRKLLNG